MSSLKKDSAVPMSIIMMDYCSSPEEVTAFVESMKDVIVYVEARNLPNYKPCNFVTQDIWDILTIAGVRINKTFKRNTTHVIFTNGRLKTYNKAKKFNIPLVNDQWFEACMRNHRVCDPSEFPISDLKCYEDSAERINFIDKWLNDCLPLQK